MRKIASRETDRRTETQDDRRTHEDEIIGLPAGRDGPRTIPKLLLVFEIYMLRIFAEVRTRFCKKKQKTT